jgi:hypothetical protein
MVDGGWWVVDGGYLTLVCDDGGFANVHGWMEGRINTTE